MSVDISSSIDLTLKILPGNGLHPIVQELDALGASKNGSRFRLATAQLGNLGLKKFATLHHGHS